MKFKKLGLVFLLSTFNYVLGTTYNCDSNCLNGVDMTAIIGMNPSQSTGSQITTSNEFAYFIGTGCSGTNLVNKFSNGSETFKNYNSYSCGYVDRNLK